MDTHIISNMPAHYFNILMLDEANRFLATLPQQAIDKIFFNIDMAAQTNDPRLLKKIHQHIWEFRTTYSGNEIRLLAFWDKSDSKQTLVVASNGFIKKSAKIPSQEIQRALRIRARYFEEQK